SKSNKSSSKKKPKSHKSKQTSPEEIREIVVGILKELLPSYMLQSPESNFNPIRPVLTEKPLPIQDNKYRSPVPEIPDEA
ncbi:26269_t:CDS:1, partial [Dentiscutata erythropus]